MLKTIYLVSRAICPAGPINQALNILTGLNKYEDVDATLVTLSPEFDNKSGLDRFRDNGIKVHQLNLASYDIIGCVRKLNKFVKENGIQIVHSSGYRADLVNLLITNEVKKVSTQRSYPNKVAEDLNAWMQPMVNSFHLSVIKKLDCIVACSKSLQSVFDKDYCMTVSCVQNAVNTDYFMPIDAKLKEKKRYALCLPTKKRIYLVLGILNQRKNNTIIIDAFKQVKNENNLLVFVGGGPEDTMLKQQAEGDNRIIFAGTTKSPIDYLQSADVLISSSLAEGLPNTVLEALASGLPVLLSDIDPHKELIEGNDAGIIFNRNNSNELALRIHETEEWDMASRSSIARNLAVEYFSVKALARNYYNVYKTLV